MSKANGTTLNRKQFLKLGAGALAAAAVAGPLRPFGALAQTAPLTVAWWGEGDQNRRTADAMKAFTEKTGIAVNPQGTSFAGYFDRLATQIAGGNPPDVFQVYLANMAEYASRGSVAVIGDYLGKAIDTADWSAPAIDSVSLGDKKYFVPLGLSTQPAVIYDKTTVDGLGITGIKPDWTLAEFRATCLEIGKGLAKSTGKDAYGTDDMGGQIPAFEAFIRSKGKQVFAAAGGLGFDKADLTEWYEFWDKARADGVAIPPQAAVQGGFEANPLIRGIAGIGMAASAKGLQGFQSLTKHDLNFNPWPRYSDKTQRIELVTPVEWMVISAKSAQKEQAAKLLSFLVNDKAAVSAMGIAHGVPVSAKMRKEMVDGGQLSEIERKIYKNAEDALPFSRPRVLFPAGSQPLVGPGTPLLALLNQQIAFKQVAIPAAVDRFFAEAQRVL